MSGRRAPVIAGVVMALVVILAFLFLVNPKRSEVSEAQATLDDARSQEITLESQKASLQQAEAEAPTNRRIIRQVEQQLPPTADPQGFILLLSNAADKAGVELVSTAVGTPLSAAGVTTIPITMSITGTYFSIDELLFQLETLPRAAKVISVTLAPGDTAAPASLGSLSMQVGLELYTTDSSAGPSSDPGPTEGEAPVLPVPGTIPAPPVAVTSPSPTG